MDEIQAKLDADAKEKAEFDKKYPGFRAEQAKQRAEREWTPFDGLSSSRGSTTTSIAWSFSNRTESSGTT